MTDSAIRIRRGYVGPVTLTAAGWASALLAYAASAIWVALHQPAISSDDSLFLLRGLTRFSILDFSPQFPGYPGFVAMGRALLPVAGDPLHALALLSAMTALAIPPVAALVAWRNGNGAAALAAFALTLAEPLAPDLGLSLLTDGSGILVLLVFLALLPRPDEAPRAGLSFLAGAALAWALACRPSDAPLFVAAAAGAVVASRRIALPAIAGGLAVLAPVVAVIAALEGAAYMDEAARFLAGHATLWGNTPFAEAAHGNWLAALAAIPTGVPLAALIITVVAWASARLRTAPPALVAAVAAFVAYAAWIVAFQNPDQLRHLAALAVLGGLIVAMLVPRTAFAGPAAALMLGLEVLALVAGTTFDPRAAPPLTGAIEWLDGQSATPTVATNLGVEALRSALPTSRIYDAYYAGDMALGLATASGPAYRLTTTPLAQPPIATFRGRFAGEPGLLIRRMN